MVFPSFETSKNVEVEVEVSVGMDISAGSVPAGPNITGRMKPRDEQKHLDRIYE